jgi:hypothetical protein
MNEREVVVGDDMVVPEYVLMPLIREYTVFCGGGGFALLRFCLAEVRGWAVDALPL